MAIRKLKIDTSKMRPMCRHCFAYVQFQMTIDQGRVALNPDGRKHECPGVIEDQRKLARLYERLRTE